MPTFKSRQLAGIAAVSVIALTGLSACSSNNDKKSAPSSAKPSMTSVASTPPSLATTTTAIGTIVVTDEGMTVYTYDKDTKGASTSACTAACLKVWPPVETKNPKPQASGVAGILATIKTADGKLQITLNGSPLYTYAKDDNVGVTLGQAVGGVWWAVAPDGSKITKTG